MDRPTLHDLGSSRMRGEGAQYQGDEEDEMNLRATRTPRRNPTTSEADAARRPRPNQADDDAMHRHSSMASPASIPAMDPWDEQSDGEGSHGRSPRGDRRKSVEATTPTLMDEEDFIDEDDEQEMVSLERERLRRTSRGLVARDESDLRRTPGAQMYRSGFDQESMRRTPGASQMHRSAVAPALSQEAGGVDASGLGFGLTLSTPVASSATARPLNLSNAWESSLDSARETSSSDQADRPPLHRGSGTSTRDQRGAFVANWRQESGHGAYSPNTLRLSEDLGNLLLEDDGDVDELDHTSGTMGQFVFGSDKPTRYFGDQTADSKQEGSESWTAPYVVSMEGPSRVPRSSTNRGRRGKADGSRRSRGYERSSVPSRAFEDNTMAKTGGFLQYTQQPKPVRNVHPEPFSPGFNPQEINFGSPTPDFTASRYGGGSQDDTPRLLNFGGAFAPPAKNTGTNFQRPAPVAPQPLLGGGAFYQPPVMGNQPNFPGDTGGQFGNQPNFLGDAGGQFGGQSFHNPFQPQGQPQFGGNPPAKFQPQFSSQNVMFGGNHPQVNHPPPLSFTPHGVVYPMHGTGMHGATQDFIPNMTHVLPSHQRPQLPQFGGPPPPQSWAGSMEMTYDGMQQPVEHGSWHGGHGAWPMGDYGYAMPRSTDSPALSMTPTPQSWTPEHDLVADMQCNSFAIAQQPLAPSPGPAGRGPKKAQRKGPKKSTKPQVKADKKVEPSATQAVSGKKSPMLKKGKKKQSKSNLFSSAVPTPTDEISQPTFDEAVDAKRAELEESNETKAALKDFTKKLKSAADERGSFKDAEAFAFNALADNKLPESIHWKVYLELAELAKRANRFGDARNLYEKVCRLQPYAIQGWLEFSKLEEECGNMNLCGKILRAGIEYCEYNDGLFSRAIKHEEKMGNLSRARELLSRLKHLGIENVWRTVLEGALLEARAGNDIMARRVLKYLMHHVAWYGPLYLEAYKLEKNLGRFQEALEVVERGLRAVPRYGPLWFGAFKLCEELDQSSQRYLLPQSMSMIDRATLSVSKEVIWKVHFEAAHMLERTAVEYLDPSTDPASQTVFDLSRKRFAMAVLTCPSNQKWKVWLASGRMEVAAGNTERARRLFLRAHKVGGDKGRAVALLECARLEEYVGDVDLSKAILCEGRSVSGTDWKVWLESVLLEIRCGSRARAIQLAELALQLHSGAGRLWASLVQLRHFEEGEAAQFESLRLALNSVPKSGEVWCEGARIHLNPFARTFDIPSARRHLSFATKFTPQYGDGFLESLRLELIDQWLVPISKQVWESTRKHLVLEAETEEDRNAHLASYVNKVAQALFAIRGDKGAAEENAESIVDSGTARLVNGMLRPAFRDSTVDVMELRQRCANADPNYGSLWFYCRETTSGTARKTLSRALELMLKELSSYAHIYLSALIRRLAILAQFDRGLELKAKRSGSDDKATFIQNTARWEESMIEAYLAAPSLETILAGRGGTDESTTSMVLLESTMTGSNFVCGLVALCTQVPVSDMTSSDKRKALFGTDALFS